MTVKLTQRSNWLPVAISELTLAFSECKILREQSHLQEPSGHYAVIDPKNHAKHQAVDISIIHLTPRPNLMLLSSHDWLST